MTNSDPKVNICVVIENLHSTYSMFLESRKNAFAISFPRPRAEWAEKQHMVRWLSQKGEVWIVDYIKSFNFLY